MFNARQCKYGAGQEFEGGQVKGGDNVTICVLWAMGGDCLCFRRPG